MPLTIKEVKHAKPGRHSDGKGLYLLVKPSGAASWVLRVQYQGERKDFGLGSLSLEPVGSDIPLHKRKLLTLAEARDKAREGRALAKAGINPSERWRETEATPEVHTFREVAKEAHKHRKGGWKNTKHREEWLASLERYAFPFIGDMSVDDVEREPCNASSCPSGSPSLRRRGG
jgi:Arm DNA-binding domain